MIHDGRVDADRVDTAIEECLRSAEQYPAMVVGVSTLDRRWVRVRGAATGDTLFELGSITKVFTGLLLAVAEVRGEARLDEPLQDLISGVPVPAGRSGRPIRLSHLATHTSGLPRIPVGLLRQIRGDLRDPYAGVDAPWLYASLAATRLPAWRQPGRRYKYSNLGMGLLGHALARRLTGGADTRGEDYHRMVEERICAPLGLVDTVHVPAGDQVDRLAPGHNGAGRPTPHWDLAALAGAGGLRATAGDLLTFLDAQLAVATGRTAELPTALPAELAEAMASTHPVWYAGRRVRVGLAWHINPRGEPEVWWHDGGTGGGASVGGFVPAEGLAIVVLANRARAVWRTAMTLRKALQS